MNVVNSKRPRYSFQGIIVVDLATAEIVAHSLFRNANVSKGEVPAYKVTLRDAFMLKILRFHKYINVMLV